MQNNKETLREQLIKKLVEAGELILARLLSWNCTTIFKQDKNLTRFSNSHFCVHLYLFTYVNHFAI
jgi:hypothetical protein